MCFIFRKRGRVRVLINSGWAALSVELPPEPCCTITQGGHLRSVWVWSCARVMNSCFFSFVGHQHFYSAVNPAGHAHFPHCNFSPCCVRLCLCVCVSVSHCQWKGSGSHIYTSTCNGPALPASEADLKLCVYVCVSAYIRTPMGLTPCEKLVRSGSQQALMGVKACYWGVSGCCR